MTSIEDLNRREEKLTFLLKVFVGLLILLGIFLVGWMISFIGYADDTPLKPDPRAVSAVLRQSGFFPIA